MVILSGFRMRQKRHDDHREDAPHFKKWFLVWPKIISLIFSDFLNWICNPGDYNTAKVVQD